MKDREWNYKAVEEKNEPRVYALMDGNDVVGFVELESDAELIVKAVNLFKTLAKVDGKGK